ncbi:MAG TPA: EfeM/EfeO family lipoprotein [Flexivirga sp.]|uniref:EfeM/EfeO family lipoprotein n=1 Tax=Flexivirga sp. TaxID=1962927 RepID=UPI002BB4B250|nr:EfeM/EfeO family lipoprotein [Flexivirga sp.]HWC23113.1 EfeM/EfeO family lipoprotein [Flexivirga sp.]
MTVALIALPGCQADDPTGSTTSAAPAAAEAQVSRSHCGTGWTHASSGPVQVRVHNTDVNAAEAYLADSSGRLYGEIDPLAPGATAVLRTELSAGSYHLVCSVNDGTPVKGPKVSVTGDASGVRGVRPVTSADLAPHVIAYQGWVKGRLKLLRGQAKSLSAALRSGDRGTARAAWKTANRTWNTMGGAYGAFGDRGAAIAGDAHPFAKGVHDPHWTGLLRIEYGLWHGQSPVSLATLGDRLQKDLGSLDKDLESTQFEPLDVVNRTHEITEDTLQQTLTGRSDYGAHVELSDALAQLDGTCELLKVLHPLLSTRYPQLPTVNSWIAKARKDIRAQHDWRVTPPGGTADAGHRLVDADIAQLAELLTPIPTMLEPRVTR